MQNVRLLIVLISALLMTATCQADTAYSSRVAFATALGGGATIQNFDSLNAGDLITTLDGVTYSPGDGGTALVTNSFTPLSPPNGLGDSTVGYFTTSVTFTFASLINAFGISINTFDHSTGGYLLTTNTGSVALSYFDPFPVFQNGQFVGTSTDGEFVGLTTNSPFTSITLSNPGSFSYTLDDLTYRSVSGTVPEPGALRSLFLGLMMLIAAPGIRRKFNERTLVKLKT